MNVKKTVNVYEEWIDAIHFRDKPEGLSSFFVNAEVAPGVLVVLLDNPKFENDWELRVRVGSSPFASVRSADVRAGRASREALIVPFDKAGQIHIEGEGDVPSIELTSATQSQDSSTNLNIFGRLNITPLLDDESPAAKATARLTYISHSGTFASCSVWHIGNGYFLTNNHCVEKDGEQFRDITINLGDVVNAPVKIFPEVKVRAKNHNTYRLADRLDYALLHSQYMPSGFANSAFKFAKLDSDILIAGKDALSAYQPNDLRVYQYFSARGKRGLFRAEDPENCRVTQQICNKFAFGHKCDTEAESSGGAITDQNDQVIGLHYTSTGSRNCGIYAGQIYSHLETHHSGDDFWPVVKSLFKK